ncbi:MAG: sodium:solute symporter [Bacteroidia bacterium]
MSWIDWLVLILTLVLISVYGIWKTRGKKNLDSYLASDRNTPWWAIGLSIMATQASAITFISTPGMGYEHGLKFAQFYYGLPIAMVIIALFFAPRFFHLKVFTAYEYLEGRFNLNTRLFTAALFLIQRGLAAGVTIYAPSIILAEIMGWNLMINIWIIGLLVIIYTVSGGTDAVTQTHKQQMAIIFIGLFVAFGFLIYYIQEKVSMDHVMTLASAEGMLKAFDTNWDLGNRYNVWSGLIGGTFLMLSYFGTDQSQVQRYISGKSLKEIRTGLYFNAILKIPMQFFILFMGVLVFSFYTIYEKPLSFDSSKLEYIEDKSPEDFRILQDEHERIELEKIQLQNGLHTKDLAYINEEQKELNIKFQESLSKLGYTSKVKETDFVFISWILKWLPAGLVGLLIAVIFSAAMSSTAAELNALATTTTIDFYKRNRQGKTERHYLRSSKWLTLFWGLAAIAFASVATLFDNLVEFVNILGSLFYGTILGIFIVGLFIKYINSRAVLWAAIIAQCFIFYVHFFQEHFQLITGLELSFLWYNFIACAVVVIFSMLFQGLKRA